ncbi:MAG: succinylglutamate desuccinylase [Candidatus Atribacteria bacterium]|nr:MAG: succinylglutamate desuccinylase [Candidatus Atribacteria bacterium]
MHKPKIRGVILIIFILIIVSVTIPSFLSMHEVEPLFPGPGVIQTKLLSDYFEGLKNTPGDTEIYLLEGTEKGGTVLLLGGVHPDEPAAFLTTVLFLERATISKGRIFIIPRTNKSGFTYNIPGEAAPQRFPLETNQGTRWFRFGARGINPIHSWPDQEIYIHYPSGQRMSGDDTRNLNRSFPGRPNGTLAEKITYGVAELIRQEGVDLTIDFHTAMPEYPNINVIVAHERAMEIAASAQLTLLLDGINIGLANSPKNFHGLTHREIGDFTDSFVVLMEAPNIAFGRLRGRTTVDTVIKGQDDFYVWGDKIGRLFIPFTEEGWPLNVRLARHITTTKTLIEAFSELYPDKSLMINNIPSYQELVDNAGSFYHPPEK